MEKENQTEIMQFEFRPDYDLIKEEDVKHFMTSLPRELNKATIKELLLQLPQQITHTENYALVFKKDIGDAKVALKAKKSLLEIEKSEVRKLEMDRFLKQHDDYMQKTQNLMREIMNSNEQNASLKKAYLQEVSRAIKPEKPTKAELDDIANIQTRHLQREIDELEQKISDYQFELELLSTKKDFYNNMWVTLRKYADVVVNEMKMLGER